MSSHRSTQCISVGKSAICNCADVCNGRLAENADGNGRPALQMYHVQFPDRRMPDCRIFQLLHRQLCKTRSFPVTKHDAVQRRAKRSPSLEERILNVVADRN
ncbi:hypothetical protein TNCV_3523961 [Trichonephila clavipes]|uniref:Uncharacterized protein n=1 Tax=Trichonephila clavipes TaxID=2585209 RepID=A0A8X6S8C9_TRICX|nr:hypothetical protein TNCV_3523961 [Trichonephila clavipes]